MRVDLQPGYATTQCLRHARRDPTHRPETDPTRSIPRGRSIARASISHLGLSVILSCWLADPALAQKKVPDGAKVFLLSGGQRQHHGYREQALYLAGTLENTGRFQVTIGEDAAVLETPAFRKYDLVIVTADRRDPEFKFTRDQQEAIFDFVRSGPRLCLDPRRRQRPAGLAARMERNARRHLLTRRQTRRQGAQGNLYRQDRRHGEPDYRKGSKISRSRTSCTPTCRCSPTSGRWPRSSTRASSGRWRGPPRLGKGRVFHTSLGHRDFGPDKDDPLRNPNLNKLIIQGVDWVAAGACPRRRGQIRVHEPRWNDGVRVIIDWNEGEDMPKSARKAKQTVDRSRRTFLAATGGLALNFMIVPRHVLGGAGYIAPSERVNVGGIGAGGHGGRRHRHRRPARSQYRRPVRRRRRRAPPVRSMPFPRRGDTKIFAR